MTPCMATLNTAKNTILSQIFVPISINDSPTSLNLLTHNFTRIFKTEHQLPSINISLRPVLLLTRKIFTTSTTQLENTDFSLIVRAGISSFKKHCKKLTIKLLERVRSEELTVSSLVLEEIPKKIFISKFTVVHLHLEIPTMYLFIISTLTFTEFKA